MIKDVIDALEVDLQKYSSPTRKKRKSMLRQELMQFVQENSYDRDHSNSPSPVREDPYGLRLPSAVKPKSILTSKTK